MIAFDFEFDSDDAFARLTAAEAALSNTSELYARIAQALEAETERNFEAQGRPAWVPLAKATIAERQKRNKGGSVLKILQDRGILAASVSSEHGVDYALIGANTPYAAIQQFGGTINRDGFKTTVRLRTDKSGNLLRQGTEGSAKGRAVFARSSHKRVRETEADVGPYTITIPARPYLPFSGSPGNAVLQPEAERTVLDLLMRTVSGAFE